MLGLKLIDWAVIIVLHRPVGGKKGPQCRQFLHRRPEVWKGNDGVLYVRLRDPFRPGGQCRRQDVQGRRLRHLVSVAMAFCDAVLLADCAFFSPNAGRDNGRLF